MGVVYEAEHESLKSRVALKVMHPRFRADARYLRRFHAEARLAAGLHHTNIVSVFDYGEQGGVCYYAMQFIHGQPLDLVLADIHRLRDEATSPGGPLGLPAIRQPAAVASLAGSAAVKGLLTGRYAEPAGTATAATDPDPAAAIGPVGPDTAVDAGTGPADPGVTRAFPDEAARAEPAGGGGAPSTLSSTSMGGSGEARYYREIARVGAQVADALDYAHRRGILHRDIKPSNLLLDALGNVWVTDFGLAKLEEGDDLTQSHELVGTLRYMAPERFRGTSSRRGDIYSLGATLYELVTLRPPFEESDQIRLIERIRDDAPPPPRQLDRNIPRDLETIVLKALSKDPEDRFGSADELAGELRRFVDGRPIRSRPVSVAERFWRWCKRERWLAGASIAATLLTIVLALGSTGAALIYRGQVRRIGEQRDQIAGQNEQIRTDFQALQRADAATRASLADALVAQARATRFSRRPGQRFDALEALGKAARIVGESGRHGGGQSAVQIDGRDPRTGAEVPAREIVRLRLPPEDIARLRDQTIACLALPDIQPTGRVITQPGLVAFAVDSTVTQYAMRFHDGTISVRREADDRETAHFQARGDRDFHVFGFSPDGRYLASGDAPGPSLKVWDLDRRALAAEVPGPVGTQFAWSPDGRRLLLSRLWKLVEYDLATGRLARTWPGAAGVMAFRPDGARIAVIDTNSKSQTCRILETDSGRLVWEFPLGTTAAWVAWSPDGRTLAISRPDRRIDLWDAPTGIRRATLEGLTSGGPSASFHPAGTLLASNGWEMRLRLWDPMLGRPLLSLSGSTGVPRFSRDGRIFVSYGDRHVIYRVDPALEYRTFADSSGKTIDYERASIHRDGRLLIAGGTSGAILWDLARGTELASLSIGQVWNVIFEPTGDLLTGGTAGVQRWPIRLDPARGDFRIGPPRRLPMPASFGQLSEDRSGRIVALANGHYAQVVTPERTSRIGPLDDGRGVAVSPDGRWLATGNHVLGAQVWRIADGTKAAELPIESSATVFFSPDGKWLAAASRLWEVGTWREARRIGGAMAFSPDGRIVAVLDPDRVIRLVEVATNRTLARLESPDLCEVHTIAFAPDGSRLVFVSNDGPAAHVWDLRRIRRYLADQGLDWDAPPYPEADPTDPSAPPLPTPEVDYGPLAPHLEHFNENPESLVRRHSERLKIDPQDADAYHHRAHALTGLGRLPEAIADLARAVALRPRDAHLRSLRAAIYQDLEQYEPAIDDLEAALAIQPERDEDRERLALCCNNRAWELANGPGPRRNPVRALALARRAVDLRPDEATSLNTMGVVLYRMGRFDEAVAALERSRDAHRGQYDAFDLFFLAMAHHRLGHREAARDAFDRAVRWMGEQKHLNEQQASELAAFRAEAEAVLAGPAGALPEDVFAPGR
jgi:WD40 repeat protein/tetratricopeptide (TPR) repeat protein